MTIKERARMIEDRAENDFLAARRRRDEIEKAMGMLANSGVPDELLNSLLPELEQAREDVRVALLTKTLIHGGMNRLNLTD